MKRSPEPAKKRKPPATALRYDVGDEEMLTVREIADVVGVSYGTIRQRITEGWTGPHLLLPKGERRKERKPRTRSMLVACTLAIEFGRVLPSTKQIREAFPMEEAAAAYWRTAYRQALEKSNQPRRRR